MNNRKKNANQQLNAKRSLFFNCGLCISLLLVISAFEWKSTFKEPKVVFDPEVLEVVFEGAETVPMPTPRPPAPRPRVKQILLVEETPVQYEEEQARPEPIDFDEMNRLILTPAGIGEEKVEEFEEYNVYEARFEGGKEAFYTYIRSNLKYPEHLRRMGILGTVLLSYVIDEEGKITEVKVVESVHEDLDKEAIRVLENSPNWIPAQRVGRKVKVRMKIPISFKLDM